MVKSYKIIISIIVLAALAGLLFAIFWRQEAQLMGTSVEVKGAGRALALLEIKRLDKLFNRFDAKSEISLINQAAGKHPVKVSRDTYQVIKQAYEVSRLTAGAFDITLGKNGRYRDILLDPDGQWVFLRRPGMSIDLGGIGKGYAVEAARKRLIEKKISRALIDLHSSMAAIGGPWRIGIQNPLVKDKLIGVVELNDGAALSTSGNYERGKHIIDPRTGQPADGVAGVTIIGKDAGLVDGFSTAVFVLGTMEGMRLIEMIPSLSGVIITKQGKVYRSRGLELQ